MRGLTMRTVATVIVTFAAVVFFGGSNGCIGTDISTDHVIVDNEKNNDEDSDRNENKNTCTSSSAFSSSCSEDLRSFRAVVKEGEEETTSPLQRHWEPHSDDVKLDENNNDYDFMPREPSPCTSSTRCSDFVSDVNEIHVEEEGKNNEQIRDEQKKEQESNDEHNQDQCTLYLAESSIPNAGMGVYTSIPLKPSTRIGSDIVLPFVDMGTEEERDSLYPRSLWQDYTWIGSELHRFDSIQADVLSAGLGAHINCHMGLVNVELGRPKIGPVTTMHRSKDPGIGAFSNYHSMHMKVQGDREIEAGSELFVSYGDHWFLGREEVMGIIPLSDDFVKADEIIRKTLHINAEVRASSARAGDDAGKTEEEVELLEQDMWELIRNHTSQRVGMALPTNINDVRQASKLGGAARYSLPNFVRSQQWLREHGWCIDNLYADASTVPQAGRGAFAKRFMPKDSVIMTSPLLHIGRDALRPYEYDILDQYHRSPSDKKEKERRQSMKHRVRSEQLILNYLFGHVNSSVLLLPYAPVVNFINHNDVEPNAKIQWLSRQHDNDNGDVGGSSSSSFSFHHSEWLNISSEEVIYEKRKAGLVMEYVALRDIQRNEEIFIDYGRRWSDAWKRYVDEWEPPPPSVSPDGDHYKSASDIVRERGEHDAILTVDEQINDPYPKNVYTGCYYSDSFYNRYDMDAPKGDDDELIYEGAWDDVEDGEDGINRHYGCFRPCEIISKYNAAANVSNVATDGHDKEEKSDNYYCHSSISYYYTAVMTNDPINDELTMDMCYLPRGEVHVISNIPLDAIVLADMPYTTDQHLPNVFRHELGVPLNFFPAEWMDL